jgi:hypothetical protein
MKDLFRRSNSLTEELHALRLRLVWNSFQSSSPREQDRLLNTLLAPGLLEDIKNVVDQMVNFLWCYIESAAAETQPLANSRAEVDYDVQSKRLMRVAEMLRLLRTTSSPDNEHMAFVARLTLAVDQQLERNRDKLCIAQPERNRHRSLVQI